MSIISYIMVNIDSWHFTRWLIVDVTKPLINNLTMPEEVKSNQNCSHPKLSAGFALSILLNVIVLGVLSYGAISIEELRSEVDLLNYVNKVRCISSASS